MFKTVSYWENVHLMSSEKKAWIVLFCLLTWKSKFLYQVEAVMNDFIQLKPQSNVYEAETMVEG